jgi:hypothetical protein
MAVDPLTLLDWMAARERRLGSGIDGALLLSQTGHLDSDLDPAKDGAPHFDTDPTSGEELEPWEAVARAVDLLCQLQALVWRPQSTEIKRPAPGSIDQAMLSSLSEIRVSGRGHLICDASRSSGRIQFNFIESSTVGQLGMGDNTVGDVRVLLSAAQVELEHLEAPAELKAEAREKLARIQEVAGTIGTSAAASLITAALQSALGLR